MWNIFVIFFFWGGLCIQCAVANEKVNQASKQLIYYSQTLTEENIFERFDQLKIYWRDLSQEINKIWLYYPSLADVSIFDNYSNENQIPRVDIKAAANFYLVEYLIFGQNNDINKKTVWTNEEIASIQQSLILLDNALDDFFQKKPAVSQVSYLRYEVIINNMIKELKQAMDDSIANANPVFLSERYSWQTLESYFWQLTSIEKDVEAKATSLFLPMDKIKKQFIKTYRKLVGISYSQYLLGASALFKAGGDHDKLAILIDHDDLVIALTTQIKSVSGRKKINKFIDELNDLKGLLQNN